VVFLVALPMCLGVALASDAPLISGVISGVIGGVVVGLLSGSHTSIAGPAAGLTVVMAYAMHTLGRFEVVLAAGIAAGLLQILFGLMRLGFLAMLVPSSVIKGMLASIGLIVVITQIPHALGRDEHFEGAESFWFHNGQENNLTELMMALVTWHPGVTLISAVSLLILWAWDHPKLAAQAWTRAVPAPLVVVLVAIGMNELFAYVAPQLRVLASERHLVQLPHLDIARGLPFQLPRPELDALAQPVVWLVGLQIAVLASLESLLGVEATDRLDNDHRITPRNRELLAQGAGNVLSSFLGGLPLTAVVLRSTANIYAGARSRMSAVVHGGLLALLVLAVPDLLNRIPLGALAAILLQLGYRLARWGLFAEMWERGYAQFLPFITTVVVTLVTDLLTGVGAGLGVGVFATLAADYHAAVVTVHEDDLWMIRLTRDVSFLQKYALVLAFERVLDEAKPGHEVVVDGARASFIDPDIQDVIERFVSSAHHRGIQVTLRRLERKMIHARAIVRAE
jgi:MFS superfamily sulfate permease-like transporter